MIPALDPSTLTVTPEVWEERLLEMHGATDSEAFIQAVFRLIEATVSCDFSLVVLHAVDHLPMVAQDSLGRVFSYEFMEQSYRYNPATPYLMANPGVRMLTTREQLLSGDEILSHPFYEHGMKPMNFRHCLALFFWDFVPLIAHQVFAAFRREGQQDFSPADERSMLALHAHINTALKRIRRQHSDRATTVAMDSALQNLPSGATMLDWETKITHLNDSSRKLFNLWNDEPETAEPVIPELILATCAALKEFWREMLKIDPLGRVAKKETVLHPTRQDMRAEVTLISPSGTSMAHPSFLIQIQAPPANQQEIFSRLSSLTESEREAVLLVGQCLDNQQIADRLKVSVGAVKTRLFGAFKKLQINHRSQLVAMLTGNDKVS
jgi:DNA-binding CsgD family transcriptional regulator